MLARSLRSAQPTLTCVVGRGKRKGLKVMTAFAQGARRCGAAAAVCQGVPARQAGWLVAVYGVQPDTRALFERIRRGGDWLYVDNGYFRRGRFYRVTLNAVQHDGLGGSAAPERLARLGVTVAPWRRGGRHVVVCPQSDWFMAAVCGLDGPEWLRRTLARLRAATDRPIVVRRKGAARPLAADLAGAWCLVTHASNAAVEAVLAGVPVIVTGPGAAASMGLGDPAQVEAPLRLDGRRDWAARLAANQWSLDELARGDAWQRLAPQVAGCR